MSGPVVSVVTPCYRQARYLSEAVESVLAQAHPYVELLVVNDGSDDDTDAVAARYAGRIHYFRKENGGQSSARNLGLKHATGDYVLFLDADDQLHPDALSWLVAAAQKEENPLCIMGCRAFEDDIGKALREWMPPAIPSLLPWFVGRNCGPPHCFLSLLQRVRDAGGFADDLAGCEDWDLWLRLAERGAKIVPVPRVGAYYRRHPASFSSHSQRMLVDRVKVLLRLHRRFLEHRHWFDAECAQELLEAEHRVRRRCIAQGVASTYVHDLASAIGELRQAGVHGKPSWRRRVLESLLGGTLADRLALNWFRLFMPERFAAYCQDIT